TSPAASALPSGAAASRVTPCGTSTSPAGVRSASLRQYSVAPPETTTSPCFGSTATATRSGLSSPPIATARTRSPVAAFHCASAPPSPQLYALPSASTQSPFPPPSCAWTFLRDFAAAASQNTRQPSLPPLTTFAPLASQATTLTPLAWKSPRRSSAPVLPSRHCTVPSRWPVISVPSCVHVIAAGDAYLPATG